MKNKKIIGIDFGATHIRGGIVKTQKISEIESIRIHRDGTVDEVLSDLYKVIDKLIDAEVTSIGIGVPSVVDIEKGIVYDVQNIPSWQEVHLKSILEKKYGIPVFINNDANCFALGEYYFGHGKGSKDMIGLTIGTGLGAGIIINKKLFAGSNCGAGEFGMVEYLDHFYEYYASGQFFKNVFNADGEVVFENAKKGEQEALKMYAQFGTHLGNAIKTMMYTYDINLIIFGGSIRFAYPEFQKTMWESIHSFVYRKSVQNLRIEISELENAAILGAAALVFDNS